jgi:hypothetical protein
MGLIIEGVVDYKPQIHIIDRHADRVRDNLANLLVDHKALSEDSEKDGLKKRVAGLKRRYRLQCHSGDDSIKNFADSYHDELAAECAGK